MAVEVIVLIFIVVVISGKGFTVTITESDFEQPVAEIVSVSLYLVVVDGATEGFADAELNPGGEEVHEYVFPLTAVEPI